MPPFLWLRIVLTTFTGLASGGAETQVAWAKIALNPGNFVDTDILPANFKFREPYDMAKEIHVFAEHIRDRQRTMGVKAFRFTHYLRKKGDVVVKASYPEAAEMVFEGDTAAGRPEVKDTKMETASVMEWVVDDVERGTPAPVVEEPSTVQLKWEPLWEGFTEEQVVETGMAPEVDAQKALLNVNMPSTSSKSIGKDISAALGGEFGFSDNNSLITDRQKAHPHPMAITTHDSQTGHNATLPTFVFPPMPHTERGSDVHTIDPLLQSRERDAVPTPLLGNPGNADNNGTQFPSGTGYSTPFGFVPTTSYGIVPGFGHSGMANSYPHPPVENRNPMQNPVVGFGFGYGAVDANTMRQGMPENLITANYPFNYHFSNHNGYHGHSTPISDQQTHPGPHPIPGDHPIPGQSTISEHRAPPIFSQYNYGPQGPVIHQPNYAMRQPMPINGYSNADRSTNGGVDYGPTQTMIEKPKGTPSPSKNRKRSRMDDPDTPTKLASRRTSPRKKHNTGDR